MEIGSFFIFIGIALFTLALLITIYNLTNPKIHDPEEVISTDEYQKQKRAKFRLIHRDKTTDYINSAWDEINKK